MWLSNTLQFVPELHSQTLFGQGSVPNFPACSSVCLHLLHPFGCAQQKVRDEDLLILFYCFQPTFLELCDLLPLIFKLSTVLPDFHCEGYALEEHEFLHHSKHKLIYVWHFQHSKASISVLNKLLYLFM
jgi:hypothetical protein